MMSAWGRCLFRQAPIRPGLASPSGDGDGGMNEWQFTTPAVAMRAVLIAGFLYPLMAIFSRRRTFGIENLEPVRGPVIFAANHLSVADNPAVLLALPWRWRLRVATAASREVMIDRGRVQSFFAALISNGFHFSQRGSVRSSLGFCNKLASDGWSLLYFPEGIRSDDGEMRAFKPGVGLLASSLGIPVVPVHLKGTDSVLSKGGSRPRRGSIEVRFGPPLRIPVDADYAVAAGEIQEAVAALSPDLVDRRTSPLAVYQGEATTSG